MKNIIFFSGTHGVGKTTTIESLSKEFNYLIMHSNDYDHHNPYIKNKFKRQFWRLSKYYLDFLDISEKVSSISKYQFLLVDRCILDFEAYCRAFYSLSWLNQKEFIFLEKLKKFLYPYSHLPENIIFLFPSELWTQNRIKERWNSEKKKWEEDNWNYLKMLRKEYRLIYDREKTNRNIIMIIDTDLKTRKEKIMNYINKL